MCIDIHIWKIIHITWLGPEYFYYDHELKQITSSDTKKVLISFKCDKCNKIEYTCDIIFNDEICLIVIPNSLSKKLINILNF
jgi:hypothetical protein